MRTIILKVWRRLRPNPLRRSYYSKWQLKLFGFHSVGNNVRIEKSAKIINPQNLTVGDNVIIDQFTTIVCGAPGVTIGSYVHIAGHCHLAGGGGIDISDFAGLSHGVKLYSVSDDYSGGSLTNPTIPKAYKTTQLAPVSVGRHAILGANAVVLPGAKIAEGCAVGANALIKQDTDPWGVYFGQPARRMNERSKELLKAEAHVLQS